jgi:hypothetical protein
MASTAATSAPKPAGAIDSQENRTYIQKQRLWTLGEAMTQALMTAKPSDPVAAILEVLGKEAQKRTEQVDPPAAEVVTEAKPYLQDRRIAFLFEDWLKAVLEARPEKPVDFSIDFFKKLQTGAAAKPAAAASAAGTVLIAFDSSAPTAAFAAKAASVGVVELGATAVVKAIGDVSAQELLSATGLILVVGGSAVNDATIIAKLAPATKQRPGALIITGADAPDDRVAALVDVFARAVPTEKAAAAAASTGAAVAASAGRALLIVQQDDGAAAAANLLGRNVVDSLKSA